MADPPRRLTEADQAELRAIAQDLERHQATLRELDAQQQHRELRALHDRWCGPLATGTDAMAKYEHIVAFACERLKIPPKDWPSRLLLVPASALPSTKATGVYRPAERLIAVRDDLDADEIEATILHECVHHFEMLHNKRLSEDTVVWMENDLFSDWRAIRAHRYPHRYAA